MHKRGVNQVITTVLIILIVLLIVVILAYNILPVVRNIDISCLDALKAIDFNDVGFNCRVPASSYSSQPLGAFSIRISSAQIVGFQIGFEDKGSADTYEVRQNTAHQDLCPLDGVFGGSLSVPQKGDVLTYVARGSFEKVFISPILASGKKCFKEARKEQSFNVACVDPQVKARILHCVGPGPEPFCGDGIVNEGEECDGDNLAGQMCTTIPGGFTGGTLKCYPAGSNSEGQEACTFDNSSCTTAPPLPRCDLTHAAWSVSEATEGEVVQLEVDGTDCNGQSISFDILEYDSGLPDDPVNNSLRAMFVGNRATALWTTTWTDDGLFGLGNPPEYYFKARVEDSDPEEIIASPYGINEPDMLEVHRASASCPDGVVDEGEECDDGNTNNNDACTNTCRDAECGDNLLWTAQCTGVQCEECDGNTQMCVANNYNGFQTCTSTCTFGACTATEWCGDGIVNGNEQCDLGSNNGVVCNAPYGGSCNYCTAQCNSGSVQGGYCGDGMVNGNEVCDGNTQSCTIGGSTSTVPPNSGTVVVVSGQAINSLTVGDADGIQECNNECTGYGACHAL